MTKQLQNQCYLLLEERGRAWHISGSRKVKGSPGFSVAVVIRLEEDITRHAEVLGLLLSPLSWLHINPTQMAFSDCLIEFLRQKKAPTI